MCGGPAWKREVVQTRKVLVLESRPRCDRGWQLKSSSSTMSMLASLGIMDLACAWSEKSDVLATMAFTYCPCLIDRYMWLYMIVLKSFFVYVSDIFSAITMLTTNGWHSQVFNNCPSSHNGCFFIPFRIGRWLFVGCILFSFLLVCRSLIW